MFLPRLTYLAILAFSAGTALTAIPNPGYADGMYTHVDPDGQNYFTGYYHNQPQLTTQEMADLAYIAGTQIRNIVQRANGRQPHPRTQTTTECCVCMAGSLEQYPYRFFKK